MAATQHSGSKRKGPRGETTVWQWNCRGYKNKYGSLTQYVSTSTTPPELIALQETNTQVRLPGYVTYGTDTGNSLHTLVSKRLVAIQHHLQQSEPLAILLEIIPPATKKKNPMFLLNIYCRPKSPPTILKHVLEQATHTAANNPLLIVGDFNAAHPLWGYAYTNPRVNLLHKLIEDMNLTFVTDPTTSTRLGTSVTRDTNPDLTLTRNIPQADWTNLEEYLGSDHALLATTLHGLEYKARIGTVRLTDWAKMRETRTQRPGNEFRQHHLPIQDWITQLHHDVLAHTKTLQTSTTIPCIDARLLHMWEARRSLLKRLKRQRWNRKLKKRIALHTETAATYATSLCRANWLSLCDSLRGTLSTSKTWKLLRYLINPASGKTESHHNLARVIHQFPGKGADLLLTLKAREGRPGTGYSQAVRVSTLHSLHGCGVIPRQSSHNSYRYMSNEPRSSISLPRNHPRQAEEAAIARALTQTEAEVIVTDSQQAYRNFASGRIHAYTLRLINQNPPT
ncbi:hypothetical protein HPB47_005878 [Ixodes persulcatus]|uniref:Uncharacterized protein n=1 Tax=Ixodes persulcatus TaxID=34615 RepID=A0AC60PBS7_IXOPE|nr:hypothetical protein HPB47_005878 [Ixodes persulcatus]